VEERSVPLPASGVEVGALRPFLTVEMLADFLGVTPRGARLVLERGELPGFRVGRRWYLRREDLDTTVAEKVAGQREKRQDAARLLRGLPARRAARRT